MRRDGGLAGIPAADEPAERRPVAHLRARRLVPVAVIVLLAALVFGAGWHHQLSLETLVRHRAALDAFVDVHFAYAVAVFVAVYVAAVSLSIPGAVFLTIAGGVLFGVVLGSIAVVVGATVGATIIFLIARSAFSEYVVRRAGPRLCRIVNGFCADAFSYLLFLRLVPLFPFFLVNLAPALVRVRVVTFVTATALGIIPATIVFTSVGAGLDSVIQAQAVAYEACRAAAGDCRLDFDPAMVLTPQLIAALVGLGVLGLVPAFVRRVMARRGSHAVAGCATTASPAPMGAAPAPTGAAPAPTGGASRAPRDAA
jgi:uncharacterized membrane protein YdjX (TVP38/TMEM64 family)